MEKGFIFNTDRCVGCHACIVACSNRNEVTTGITWRTVNQYNASALPVIPVFFHSLACNHCEDALCMTHCPASAFYRDPFTNAVLIDQKKCIGCKYCTWACPYGSPDYDPLKRVIEKCTLCVDQVKNGDTPACAKCCPTGALNYDELNPSVSFDQIKGFNDYGIGPKINFVSAGSRERIPELAKKEDTSKQAADYGNKKQRSATRTSLSSEWSLAIFTFLVPLLVGMFVGVTLSGLPIPNELFLSTAFVTLLMSLLHLGKKERFYRAIFNLKESWLSREILFFMLFLGVSSFTIISGISRVWLIILSVALGFLTTFSIDMVYHLKTRMGEKFWHSSQTLLTALQFTALFLESFYPFVFILGVKFVLYGYRKVRQSGKNKSSRWVLTLFRIIVGMAAPLFLYILDPETNWLFILIATLLGELIDRIEFYLEMEFVSPEKEFYRSLNKEMRKAG